MTDTISFTRNPDKYILYHKKLAEESEMELHDAGYHIHSRWYEEAGWMDGMYVTYLIVEGPKGTLHKLKWQDGQKEWFECAQGHGGAFSFSIQEHT